MGKRRGRLLLLRLSRRALLWRLPLKFLLGLYVEFLPVHALAGVCAEYSSLEALAVLLQAAALLAGAPLPQISIGSRYLSVLPLRAGLGVVVPRG